MEAIEDIWIPFWTCKLNGLQGQCEPPLTVVAITGVDENEPMGFIAALGGEFRSLRCYAVVPEFVFF
jgi:hypothetical protein